jgi:hypothetical protein
MPKPNLGHLVIDTIKQVRRCNNCDKEELLNLPKEITLLIKDYNEFKKLHKDCKKENKNEQ